MGGVLQLQDGFSGEARSGAFQSAADGIADAEKANAEVRRVLKSRSEKIGEKRRNVKDVRRPRRADETRQQNIPVGGRERSS